MAFQWNKEADDLAMAWGALMAPVDFTSLANEIGGGCTAKLAKERLYWLLLKDAFDKQVEALGLELSNDEVEDPLRAFEAQFGDLIRTKPCFVGYCFCKCDYEW